MLTTDDLPTGLSFNDSLRALTGTPTELGAYTLTYTVTDAHSLTVSQTFTLNVVEELELTDPDPCRRRRPSP